MVPITERDSFAYYFSHDLNEEYSIYQKVTIGISES